MYEVATREMPERSLLCLKRNVDEQEMWAFGKEFIAIMRERPLPKIEGRAGAAFCTSPGKRVAIVVCVKAAEGMTDQQVGTGHVGRPAAAPAARRSPRPRSAAGRPGRSIPSRPVADHLVVSSAARSWTFR